MLPAYHLKGHQAHLLNVLLGIKHHIRKLSNARQHAAEHLYSRGSSSQSTTKKGTHKHRQLHAVLCEGKQGPPTLQECREFLSLYQHKSQMEGSAMQGD